MKIEPIAIFRSPMTSKFGVPRQSGLVPGLRGRIEFVPPFGQPDALRGLDGFDYLWLIWGFSQVAGTQVADGKPSFSPTVRPPVLGGNERMGVWATRSPFRPSGLGLSSVRVESIGADGIQVLGADLVDGTPIYDIKPYLAYTDAHPDARGGFASNHVSERLEVVIAPAVEDALRADGVDVESLREVLACDPRPRYHDDPARVYAMPFMSRDVRFRVSDGRVEVL